MKKADVLPFCLPGEISASDLLSGPVHKLWHMYIELIENSS